MSYENYGDDWHRDFGPPKNEDDFSRVCRLFRTRLEHLRKKGRIYLPDWFEHTLDLRNSNYFGDRWMYLSTDFVNLGADVGIFQNSDDRILKSLYQKYQDLKPPKEDRRPQFIEWQGYDGWEKGDHSAYSTA
ncbi:MAG: hypothetical protein AABW91_02170 [Nanoarchaeota archaeon]